ncbi:MAG: FG-GAP repeat domain-containing protein [Candidatus Zipacnadales bacterium]
MRRPWRNCQARVLLFLFLGISSPVPAQRFVDVIRNGPFAWLPGIVLRQEQGPLTGGDWVDLAPVDWDGDGQIDLFTGSGYGDLLFFKQRSDSLFEPPVGLGSTETDPFAFDPTRQQACPATCDWDGDGDVDLLLATGVNVYLYETRTSDDHSSFAPGVELLIEGAQSLLPTVDCMISAPTVSDKLPSLFISSPDGRVLLAERKSEAILNAPQEIVPASDLPRVRGEVADTDGDGILDLVIGTADGRLLIRRGRAGTSPISFGEAIPVGGSEGIIPGPDGSALQDLSPRAIDWDADGDIDLLLGTRSGRVALLERTSGTQFTVRPYLQQLAPPIDPGRCAAADIADWDGDGNEDLVVGGEDGLLRVYRNEGRGREGIFGSEVLIRSGEGLYRRDGGYCRPALIAHSGDRLAMVVVGGGAGDVQLLTRTERGVLRIDRIDVGGQVLVLEGLTTVSPCDYDLDGDTDMFVGARTIPGTPLGRAQPIIYLENRCNRAAPPQYNKAAQIELYTSGPLGDAPLQEAGLFQPNEVSIVDWFPGGEIEFVVTGAYGVDLFTTPMARNVYPTLFLVPGEGSHLLPPVYFARAMLLGGRTGILVGTEAYGILTWYPRSVWASLDAIN